MIWVGYCKRGELDLIRSLIFLCIPASASTAVDHEEKTTRSESFKNIVVGEQLPPECFPDPPS